MAEHAFLLDQKVGTQFSGVYYVAGVSIKKTVKQTEYSEYTLKDKSGTVFAKLWSIDPSIQKGIYVTASINVEDYKGSPSFIIRAVVPFTKTVDTTLYVQTVEDAAGLIHTFNQYMTIVKESSDTLKAPLSGILEGVFTPEFKELFFKAPSNTGTYYGKVGGALENTLAICDIASKMSSIYKFNPQEQAVLIAASLLSRIGCVESFEMADCAVEQTKNGALVGIQSLSVLRLFDAWKSYKATSTVNNPADKEWLLRVIHAVTSLEGTENLPSTKEAILLKNIVGLDAKMVDMFDYIARDSHVENGFTTFDVNAKRRYYVGTKA